MKKYLIIILILAFFLSIGYSFYFRIEPLVDARGYDKTAQNLVSGNGYREKLDAPFFLDHAVARVGPGYQFFLAGIYKIFGRHLWLVWFLQAILHSLSGFLIYKISKKIFQDKEKKEFVGIISAALFLFFIDIWELTAMLLTETLFLFLLILSIYSAVKFFEGQNYKNSIFAGAAFGLAVLTRPTILPMFLIMLGAMMYKKQFKNAALFFIPLVLIVAPWTIRNYKVHNAFILTSAAGGINLWMGNNPEATGESFYTKEMSDYIGQRGFVAAEKKGFNEGVKFILEEPLKFFELLLRKTSIYFSLTRPAAFWFHLKGFGIFLTALLSSGFAFVIFSFGISGALKALKEKKFLLNLLISFAVTAPFIVIPLVVETRYRYQIYPFLIIFSGYFLADIKNNFREKHFRNVFLIVAAVLILNSGFDLLTHFDQFQKYF